jgi:5'(3')-deoxyribonucleotidase
MQRIAIDMDEVIADFNPKHLRVFNRDYNENLTLNDLMGTRLRELRPHFKRFKGQGILYTAPHNINETGYVRVNNWLEIQRYFLG